MEYIAAAAVILIGLGFIVRLNLRYYRARARMTAQQRAREDREAQSEMQIW